LEKLARSTNKPFLVISTPDKAVGRKQIIVSPPVKISAEKYKIPAVRPENIADFADEIRKLRPDLIILASYGQIIPKDILAVPRYGCLNVHPSLLPLWRGPSPVQYAILNGDKKTGVSLIKMTAELDAGPIFAQKETEIGSKENFQSLRDKLAELGAELLAETLLKLFAEKIFPMAQDNSKATYSRILKKEDGKIDWRKPAEALERRIRAFYPWPGSYAFWQRSGKPVKIKILKAKISKLKEKEKHPIGKVLSAPPPDAIRVQCAEDFLIVEKLQMEGRKEMLSGDFLRGYADFLGSVLN